MRLVDQVEDERVAVPAAGVVKGAVRGGPPGPRGGASCPELQWAGLDLDSGLGRLGVVGPF